jgi:hypothetical protein
MNKYRLLLKGVVVGYERHVTVNGFIEIQHSKDQIKWDDITETEITQRSPVVVEKSYFIPHDDKERYITMQEDK